MSYHVVTNEHTKIEKIVTKVMSNFDRFYFETFQCQCSSIHFYSYIYHKNMDEECRTGEKEDLLNKDENLNRKSSLQTCKGITAAFGSVALVSVAGNCIQLLGRRIPDLELHTSRFLISSLGCSICLLTLRKKPVIDRHQIGTTLMYAIAVFCPAFFYFVAISLLPAALSSCITYTVDVFGSLVMFSLFWKENITAQKVIFALICIVGVTMVIQPKVNNIKQK